MSNFVVVTLQLPFCSFLFLFLLVHLLNNIFTHPIMYRIDRELTTYFFGATFNMNTGFRVINSGDQIFEAQPFKQKLAVFKTNHVWCYLQFRQKKLIFVIKPKMAEP